jgi:hypothetical protein
MFVEATTANLALCGWPAPNSLETLTLHPDWVIQLSMWLFFSFLSEWRKSCEGYWWCFLLWQPPCHGTVYRMTNYARCIYVTL